MNVNVKRIDGVWDDGYVLDKHTLSSVYTGDDQFGHPTFDTTRSEVGEALYQLKYRADWSQTEPLAACLAREIIPRLGTVGLIVPMPASTVRQRQPVDEIARELAKHIGVNVFSDVVRKTAVAAALSLKNLSTKEEKLEALRGRFAINDCI